MPTAFITGAGRGIGLALARRYAAEGWRVVATVRDDAGAAALAALEGDVRVHRLDMRDAAALAAIGDTLGDEPLDLVIANAGVIGPRRLRDAGDAAAWLDTFAINCVAPTLIAQALIDRLADRRGKLVAITSQMGSIANNNSGGTTAYRASKAALNAAFKSIAVERADLPVAIALVHPGWVQTDMGGAGAAIDVETSAAGISDVIAGLTPGDKAVYLTYHGEPIPW